MDPSGRHSFKQIRGLIDDTLMRADTVPFSYLVSSCFPSKCSHQYCILDNIATIRYPDYDREESVPPLVGFDFYGLGNRGASIIEQGCHLVRAR